MYITIPTINRISTNTGIPIATPVKSVIEPAPLLDNGSTDPLPGPAREVLGLGFEVVTGISAIVARVAEK